MTRSKAWLAAAARQKLLAQLQSLETEAHKIGMTATAHAINNAKNACGWEMAGNIVMAGKASRGQRAGESRR